MLLYRGWVSIFLEDNHTHNNIIVITIQVLYSCSALVADIVQKALSGTLLISHPIRDRERYRDGDKSFRDNCCPDIRAVSRKFISIFCNEFFFRRRPVLTSNQMYAAPVLGKIIKLVQLH